MGILDTNIRKISGLEKSQIRYWVAQTEVVDAYLLANAIDCRDYNTMQITASSVAQEANLLLAGYYQDNRNTQYQGKIPVIEITNFKPVILEDFNIGLGLVRTYIVDVSRFDKIAIGKLNTNGEVSLTYNLDQTMRAFELFNSKYFEEEDYVQLLPAGGKDFYSKEINVKSGNQYKLLIEVKNSNFKCTTFRGKRTTRGSFENITDLYVSQSDTWIRPNSSLPVGDWEVCVDVSDFEIIQTNWISADSNNSVKVSGKLTVDKLEIRHISKTVQYLYNQIGARGSNDWLKVPEWAKSAMIRVETPPNEKTVFIPNSAPNDINYPVSATPSGYSVIINKIVDAATLTLMSGASITIAEKEKSYFLETTNIGYLSFGFNIANGSNLYVEFYPEALPDNVLNILHSNNTSDIVTVKEYNSLAGTKFEKIFETPDVDMYIWRSSPMAQLRGVIYNNYCWSDSTVLYLSITGINGKIESVSLNEINFPNLLPNSAITKVIMMPWSRNPTTSYPGNLWRMNVITSRGQIYHNFPSRAANSDGSQQINDYKTFDESCVWELPERWTPVKTNTGDDATLIATGKYKYFPCLPDNSYELHPAINQDNGYGNGGFPATITKFNELNQQITFGRFWRPNNLDPQDNSLDYMGGFAAHEKLTVLGTYRSNATTGTRIALFLTNDGGRNWFCRYEYGMGGGLVNFSDIDLAGPRTNWTHQLSFTGMATEGQYQVRRRVQYTPDATTKEPAKLFNYHNPISVLSITGGDAKITIITETAHTFKNGDVICFDKLTGNVNWDWIINEGYGETSAGNGVFFKAKVVNNTTFELMSSVHNPHNNLTVRHIHSVNRCKDGYAIGAGEMYPTGGWILYCPIRESDSFARKYPWDVLEFIRLNSTATSIQRPLGVIVQHDADNTIYIGVDNEHTELGYIEMPEGRTKSFRRSSNGLFKGRMIDADSQKLFKCVFPSMEVCYLFKEIDGVMIYIGQQGHIGLSFNKGETWTQGRIPRDIFGELCHYGGISYDKKIVIDNILIQLKS